MLRIYAELPLDRSAIAWMLVMTLRRKRVPLSDADFVAAADASVDSRVWCGDTRGVTKVKGAVFRWRNAIGVLV